MNALQLKFEKVLAGLISEDELTNEELIELESLVMDAIYRKVTGSNPSQVIH